MSEIISKIKNMITRSKTTGSVRYDKTRPYIQSTGLGVVQNTQHVNIYGMWSAPPVGSDGVGLNIMGSQGNRLNISFGTKYGFKPEVDGETYYGNGVTGSHAFFDKDGNINIVSNGELNVNISGKTNITSSDDITVTAPNILINGDLTITSVTGVANLSGTFHVDGDVIANGVSLKNHVHDGVTPGGGVSDIPVQ